MSGGITENRIYFANITCGLILDVGCGVGDFAKILKKRGMVVGVDINKDYLIKAPYERKLLCSIADLPFKTDAFDFVWASAVIEHVKEGCIPEVIRVGKHAVFLTPNKNSPLDLIMRLLGKKGTWETPDHVRLYTVGELKNYGKIYGDSFGLPKRNFWTRIPIPKRFWLFMPRLSHAIFLYVNKRQLKTNGLVPNP